MHGVLDHAVDIVIVIAGMRFVDFFAINEERRAIVVVVFDGEVGMIIFVQPIDCDTFVFRLLLELLVGFLRAIAVGTAFSG